MEKTYIIIEEGFLRLASVLQTANPDRHSLIKELWKDYVAFDSEYEYEIIPSSLPTYGVFTKIMALTIYNPKTEVEYVWKRKGPFEKNRILELIKRLLEDDDDIIQQWFEYDDVIKLVEAAEGFEDVIVAIRAICGEHETDLGVEKYVRKHTNYYDEENAT